MEEQRSSRLVNIPHERTDYICLHSGPDMPGFGTVYVSLDRKACISRKASEVFVLSSEYMTSFAMRASGHYWS
jgi:hypothetical protein